jgi:alpha-mannosidase
MGLPTNLSRIERMSFQRLVFVLPSFSLDDFPETLPDDQAADLLACWTSLWHPELLCHASAIPEWKRADSSSLEIDNALVICPQATSDRIDGPLRERLAMNQCVLVEGQSDRTKTLAQVSRQLESMWKSSWALEPGGHDFFAFGYAYLQVHLLTKKLRYSGQLNQPLITEQCLEAARAWQSGDRERYEHWIQSAFDQLSQERDHYYSQTVNLIDLCLLATTTLGSSLQQQLECPHPLAVLGSAHLLGSLRSFSEETWLYLRRGIESGQIQIVGGLDDESPWPWMEAEGIARDLDRGRRQYAALGLSTPKVFARYTPGLGADSGLFLRHWGFEYALLYGWEDGSAPATQQAKIIWQAPDGSSMDAIAGYVLDAQSPGTYLALGSKLSSQLDYHQAPVLILAHWPNRVHPSFEDLDTALKRSPALGTWRSIDDYFASTQRPYHGEHLKAGDFHQARPNAQELASIDRYRRWDHQLELLHQSEILRQQMLAAIPAKPPLLDPGGSEAAATLDPEISGLDGLFGQCDRFLRLALGGNGPPNANTRDWGGELGEHLDVQIAQARQRSLLEWADALPRDHAVGIQGSQSDAPCAWILNPSTGPLRLLLRDLPGSYATGEATRVYACQTRQGRSDVVVDVPPWGWTRIDGTRDDPPSAGTKGSWWSKTTSGSIARENGILGNEFLEVHVDPEKGHVKALYIPNQRGNQLSGMLAMRLPDRSYTASRVEKLSVLSDGNAHGELEVVGHLVSSSSEPIRYRIVYGLFRGSRILEVRVEIEDRGSSRDPKSHWAWRTAWPSDAAILNTWVHGVKSPIPYPSFFAPSLVEIDNMEHRAYLMTREAPWQRKVDHRFLDSILLPPLSNQAAQTTTHRWTLGIGVDLPRPYPAAEAWNTQPLMLSDIPGLNRVGQSAWFFQCSLPHVRIKLVASLRDSAGRTRGVRLLIHETNAQSCSPTIQAFRMIAQARRTDRSGANLGELTCNGDSVTVSVRAHEQSLVDLIWDDGT